MRSLIRDLRHAIKSVVARPRLAFFLAASLGLGVGLNATIFSTLDSVLLHPFPYREPERLVFVWGAQSLDTRRALGGETLDAWRLESRSFDDIAAFQLNLVPLRFADEDTNSVRAAYVDTELFQLLGVTPFRGRRFEAADEQRSSGATVISYGFWQSRLGGAPDVIGSDITLSGVPYTVVGVMPKAFFFPDTDAQLWLPLSRKSALFQQVHAVGRLRSGVTVTQAQVELGTLAKRAADTRATEAAAPGVFSIYTVVVKQYEIALWTLFGAVGVLVVLVVVNASNLMLAHAVQRRAEIAARMAIGASRTDVLRLVSLEALVVGSAAAVFALVISAAGIRVVSSLDSIQLAGLASASMNYRVVTFAVLVSLVAGLIAGIIPAVHVSRSPLTTILQGAPVARSGSRPFMPLGQLLVAAEIGMSIVIIIIAALLLDSFRRLAHADWGFRSDDLAVIHVRLPKDLWLSTLVKERGGTSNFPRPHQLDLAEAVLSRIRELPGVEGATVGRGVPLERSDWTYRPVGVDRQVIRGPWPLIECVGPGYFRVLGVPIVEGRDFVAADSEPDSRAVIVNQRLAQSLWPGKAVGNEISVLQIDTGRADVQRRIQSRDRSVIADFSAYRSIGGGPFKVVGVVGNIRMRGLDIEPEPTLYMGLSRPEMSFGVSLVFAFRARAAGQKLAAAKGMIATAEPRATLQRIGLMQDLVGHSVGGRGTNKLLVLASASFAAVSLLLATTGIYALVSQSVARRTREMGIRMALGATPRHLVRLFVREHLRAALIGVAVGLTAAWQSTRLFASLLFGVQATDPTVFAGVTLLVAAVALAACLIPAARGSRLSCSAALRHL